jgi:RHS repeat-associated protein
MNGTGTTRATLIPDIQGSIIGTLDAASGALTKRGYRPYGESASVTGSFAYTGQRIDPETNGLYYYRARMYMPTWGRFMQVDPIGYGGGSNLYAYVGNDPLNATDPSGLCYPVCTVVGGGIIGGFVGGAYYVATAPNSSLAGFFASTAEGAVVGAAAGSGASGLVLFGVGAGAHVSQQFVVAAADNNLDRYGSTALQNAKVILGDAAVGGIGAAIGGKISEFADAYISSVSNRLATNVSPTASAGAAAAFTRGVDPALQTAGAGATGVATNFAQNIAQSLYEYQSSPTTKSNEVGLSTYYGGASK